MSKYSFFTYFYELKSISQSLYLDIIFFYLFSIKNFPYVRLDRSISNSGYGYNFYIDNGNSLCIVKKNKIYILKILKKYLNADTYEILSDFLKVSEEEVSLGINLKNHNLNYNIAYISKPIHQSIIKTYLEKNNLSYNLFGYNKVLFGINISNSEVLSYKIYYEELKLFEIDKLINLAKYYKVLSFINIIGGYDDIMLLVRYLNNKNNDKECKIYFNLYKKKKFYLNNYLIIELLGYGFGQSELSKFIGKRISSIASRGGNNMELYFDLESYEKK